MRWPLSPEQHAALYQKSPISKVDNVVAPSLVSRTPAMPPAHVRAILAHPIVFAPFATHPTRLRRFVTRSIPFSFFQVLLGAADQRVPPTQGREWVAAVESLGRAEVSALEYAGEGHAIRGLANHAHAVQSAVAWLTQTLEARLDTEHVDTERAH